jgi:hypothetical protein
METIQDKIEAKVDTIVSTDQEVVEGIQGNMEAIQERIEPRWTSP